MDRPNECIEEIEVNLVKPAKGRGGDRYELDSERYGKIVLYIPQGISREKNVPKNTLRIYFQEVE